VNKRVDECLDQIERVLSECDGPAPPATPAPAAAERVERVDGSTPPPADPQVWPEPTMVTATTAPAPWWRRWRRWWLW
jgi:hypothetical protein